VATEYEAIRRRAGGTKEKVVPLAWRRANEFKIDCRPTRRPSPPSPETRIFAEYPLHELIERIDWTPFFPRLGAAGQLSAILEDIGVAKAPKSSTPMHADAGSHRAREVADRQRRRELLAVPARRRRRRLFEDDTRSEEISGSISCASSRERGAGPIMLPGRFHLARGDWIAGFAVTAATASRTTRALQGRPRTTIPTSCCKALADRLAEAFAERLHERVPNYTVGYAPDEALYHTRS